jgi:thiamine biosynthesis lipoprotein
MHAWGFEAIGTAWQIDTRDPVAPDVRAAVLERIDEFDRSWSRFRPDSLVSDIASGPGEWQLPDEADHLFRFYAELNDATDGAVNPLVGRTLSDLGYDATYSLVPSGVRSDVPYWSTLDLTDDRLRTDEPVLIDVGAAGKGLLVDEVAAIIGRHTHQFTVDASGDLYHGGTTPLRIALEHPLAPTRAIGVAEIDPQDALCASATNRRAWGDGLHHVIDARTGRPTDDVIATWVVVAGSCMWADGLATAHFFADPGVLMDRFQHEFVRMHADGRVLWSPDFPGEIFT